MAAGTSLSVIAVCACLVRVVARPREAPTARGDSSRGSRARRLYDRGCLFSPEGRVYQVEYAQRAIERGGAACGAVGEACCVVGAMRSAGLRSAAVELLPLNDDGWRERVHRIDEHIVCVSCGLVPDARQLLRALQRLAHEHRRAWGTRVPVGIVAARLSEFVQSATLRASTRPFGAAFLLAGYDDDEGKFRLFRTDPAGFFDEIAETATVAGEAPQAARDALQGGYRADLDPGATARLVAEALAASRQQASRRLRPTDLEIARVALRDGKVVTDIVKFDEIATLIEDLAAADPSPEAPDGRPNAGSSSDDPEDVVTDDESGDDESGDDEFGDDEFGDDDDGEDEEAED